MSKYRYPGAQPFVTDQKNIFFGRSQDTEDLYRLINLENLVVLYAKSGLGKSSLLNAGIIPKILKEGRFKPISVRFGSYQQGKEEMPLYLTRQALTEGWTGDTFLDRLIPDENSLWHHTKEQQIHQGGKLHFLLIFDQFEELFTYPDEAILKFKQEVSELLHTQIPQRFREVIEESFTSDTPLLTKEELFLLHEPFDLKVVMAIRSDRMSLLNQLSSHFPSILKNCYELGALTPEQAEEAILNPAYKKDPAFLCPSFDYEDEAIESMLDFLTKGGKERIESFQLQILCQSIERKVINYQLPIVRKVDIGNVEQVYENYYDDQIGLLESEEAQEAARKLIEDGLIFEEEERRLSLYEGQIYRSFNVTPGLLRSLVDAHLLRAEPSMKGGYTYELSHDTLVGPVLRSKEQRRQARERMEAETDRQEKERELKEARRQAGEERKKKQRARLLAFVGFLLAVISLLTSGFAYHQYRKAELASQEADRQRNEAEAQRLTAEDAKNDALESYWRAEDQKQLALQNEEIAKTAEAKALGSAMFAERERQRAIKAQAFAESQTKLAKSNGWVALAHQFKSSNPTYAMRFAETALDAASENRRAEEIFNKLLWDQQGYSSEPRQLYFQKEINTYETIHSISVSKEGRFFATGGADGKVRIWKPDGTLVKTLHGHRSRVNALDFSPNGKYLLSGSSDGTTKFWSVTTKNNSPDLVGTIEDLSIPVYSAIFSPNGEYILTGGNDGTARLYYADPEDQNNFGMIKQVFKGHGESDIIYSLAFSPDGKYMLTGCGDNTARLWDWDGRVLKKFDDPSGGGKDVLSVAFYPGDREELIVLTGTLQNVVKVWTIPKEEIENGVENGILDTFFNVQEGAINDLHFIDNGRLLTSGGDKQMKIWKFDPNEPKKYRLVEPLSLKGDMEGEIEVCYVLNKNMIISASSDGKILFWDLNQQSTYIDYNKPYKDYIQSSNIAPLGLSLEQRQNYELSLDAPHLQPSTLPGFLRHIQFFESQYQGNKSTENLERVKSLYEQLIDWRHLDKVDFIDLLSLESNLERKLKWNGELGVVAKSYYDQLQNYLLSDEGFQRALLPMNDFYLNQYAGFLERQFNASQKKELVSRIKTVYDTIVKTALWEQYGANYFSDLIDTAIQKANSDQTDQELRTYFQDLFTEKLIAGQRLKAFSPEKLNIIANNLYSVGIGLYASDPLQLLYYDIAISSLQYSLEKKKQEVTYLQLARICANAAFRLVHLERFVEAIELANEAIRLGSEYNPGEMEEDLAYTNLVLGYLFTEKEKALEVYTKKWNDPYWRPNYDNFKGIFLKDLRELKWFFEGLKSRSKNETEQKKYDQYLQRIDEAEGFLNKLK